MNKWFKFLSILAEAYICQADVNDVDYAWHVCWAALGDLAEMALESPWIDRQGRFCRVQSYELGPALHTARRGILTSIALDVFRTHPEVGWVKFLSEGEQFGPWLSWILEGAIDSLD